MKDYEQLIEFVINDEQDKAKELFHQIVVKESRKIYESLVSEDDLEQDTDVDSLSDEVVSDEEGLDDMGDEMPADDMGDEMPADDMGDDEGVGEEGIEDRVMDLEDAIDELRAEFEELMAGEDAEEENFPGIHDETSGEEVVDGGDDDFDGDDDFGGDDDLDADEDEVEESNSIYERKRSQQETMREYVEKVARISNAEGDAVGAAGEKVTPNAKSIVAGKNDMGGTAKNLVKGGSEANPDGTSPKKPSNYGTKSQGQVKDAGNWENRPGAKAGNTFGKAQKPKSTEEAGVVKQSLEPGKK